MGNSQTKAKSQAITEENIVAAPACDQRSRGKTTWLIAN